MAPTCNNQMSVRAELLNIRYAYMILWTAKCSTENRGAAD